LSFGWFLLRRAGSALGVLIGVSLLSFGFMELAPGDFYDDLRLARGMTPEAVADLRAERGGDRPLPQRYLAWLGSAVRGDLGVSLAYGTPVAPLVARRAGNTLLLAVIALAAVWSVGVPVGVLLAHTRRTWLDRGAAPLLAVSLAVPEIVLAVFALAVAAWSGVLPLGGMMPLAAAGPEAGPEIGRRLLHLVVPVAVLVAAALPTVVQHTRDRLVEVLDGPVATAARARGLAESRVLWVHALRLVANPLVALFGLGVAGLLSASLVVEVVVGWPGLGSLLFQATFARDAYVVLAAVMLSTVMLLAGNLAADVLLYALDPSSREAAG